MKKIISLSLALTMLIASTACGKEESELSPEAFVSAAEKLVDSGYDGIISSGKNYCSDDDAEDYRKSLKKEGFDGEWILVFDDGEPLLFYADDFDKKAECDGKIPSAVKGMTLEEIYDYYIDRIGSSGSKNDDEKDPVTITAPATKPPVTKAPVTTVRPVTTVPVTAEPPAPPSLVDSSVKTDGDTFTIASWDANDIPALVAQWKGISYDTAEDMLASGSIPGVDFLCLYCGGSRAIEYYDRYFINGTDIDVFCVEADWALRYTNDDSRTLPLSKLGLDESDFPNCYNYTMEIGRNRNGVLKGVSWQAAPGGFAYNAELAEQYLGVQSPEEMQAKLGSWDGFVAAAQEVSSATNGNVALADSVGGLWQAYSCGRSYPWVMGNELQIDDICTSFAITAKNLWDMGGVARCDQWSMDWTANGVSGTTMGYFVSTWGFSSFLIEASGGYNGEQYGKWNVCQGPMPYYWGGTWLVVNSDTDNGNEAREFLLSACGDDYNMTEYAKKKPDFVNNVKIMNEIVNSNTVFNEYVSGNFRNNQNYFAVLADCAANINLNGLVTEYDSTIGWYFIDTVRKEYLENSKDWNKTLEIFKEKVKADYGL